MRSFGYFFKEAFKGLKRNLGTTIGSVVTIFLSLFIIGIFLVGGVIANNIVKSVESEVSITAYVADDASQTDITTVENYIKGLEGVGSVSFTTKDEALKNFRTSMASNPEIVDQLDGQNPLPASIDIELSSPQMVEQVADSVEKNSTFIKICDNPNNPSDSLKYGQKTVEKLFDLTKYLRYIGIALIVLLIFIALVFINNTIRLAILARRKEISIMRLVGASNGFIRGPFLAEGALHALIGSVFAIGCLELMRRLAIPQLQTTLSWLPLVIDTQVVVVIYIGLLVAGLIIGLIGSAFAMRKYLKI